MDYEHHVMAVIQINFRLSNSQSWISLKLYILKNYLSNLNSAISKAIFSPFTYISDGQSFSLSGEILTDLMYVMYMIFLYHLGDRQDIQTLASSTGPALSDSGIVSFLTQAMKMETVKEMNMLVLCFLL